MKILLLCSKGGHLQEMNGLRDAWSKYDYTIFTYDSERTRELTDPHYLITEPSDSIPGYIFSLAKAMKNVLFDRPDVLMSTGMGYVDVFMFPFCRLIGVYTIYIESAANIHEMTGTGKIVRIFADKFMVQWEELAEKTGAEFHGGVL